MTRVFNGKAFHDPMYEYAIEACKKGLKENPDLVIYYDLESGYPSLITKEEQKAIIDLWESAKPKLLNDKPIGKVFIFGTGSK